MDSRKYFSLSYKVIWRESMDSCKIPLGDSKWILALGCEISDPELVEYNQTIFLSLMVEYYL